MNGPEHYREAERLLADAMTPREIHIPGAESPVSFHADQVFDTNDEYQVTDLRIAAAQAHATLAHAAATIEAEITKQLETDPTPTVTAWSEAVS